MKVAFFRDAVNADGSKGVPQVWAWDGGSFKWVTSTNTSARNAEAAASLSGTNWTYGGSPVPFPPLSDFAPSQAYEGKVWIKAVAYNETGGSNFDIEPFTIDTDGPALAVTTPANGTANSISTLPKIVGTAQDPAGVSRVVLWLYKDNSVDASKPQIWDWSTTTWKPWGTGVTGAPATLSAPNGSNITWSYSDATKLPSGGNLPDGTYKIRVAGNDMVGNYTANSTMDAWSTFRVSRGAQSLGVLRAYRPAASPLADSDDASSGAAGGDLHYGLEVQVGPWQQLDPTMQNVTFRLQENDAVTHPNDAERHIEVTMPLDNNYGWQVWTGTAWAWSSSSPQAPNASDTIKRYRRLMNWPTTRPFSGNNEGGGVVSQSGLTLPGHNGAHTLILLKVNGAPATQLTFDPVGDGNAPDYKRTVANKGINVQNLTITGVKTSNGTADYFKFDPASTDTSLLQPTVTFAISDAGDPHRYRWRVRARSTDKATWGDNFSEGFLITGETDGPGVVLARFNDSTADNQDQDAPLTEWGTYTFDVSVDEIDANGNVVGDVTQSYRSPYLYIPYTMPGQIDPATGAALSGHYLSIGTDANGNEPTQIGYYLRDDARAGTTGAAASDLKVQLLPPSLGSAIATASPDKTLNTAFLDKPLYTFVAGSREEGTYISVMTGADNHAVEYRDHQNHRMLAKNGRIPGLKIDSNVDGRNDRVVSARDTQAGLPGGIKRVRVTVPTKVTISLEIQARPGTTGSAFFDAARTQTTLTNVSGQRDITIYGGDVSGIAANAPQGTSATRNMQIVATSGTTSQELWAFTVFRVDLVPYKSGNVDNIIPTNALSASGLDKNIGALSLRQYYKEALSVFGSTSNGGVLGANIVAPPTSTLNSQYLFGGIVIRGKVIPSGMSGKDFNRIRSRSKSFFWQQLISSRLYNSDQSFFTQVSRNFEWSVASQQVSDNPHDENADLLPDVDSLYGAGELSIWFVDTPGFSALAVPNNGDKLRVRYQFMDQVAYAGTACSKPLNWFYRASVVNQAQTLTKLTDKAGDNIVSADSGTTKAVTPLTSDLTQPDSSVPPPTLTGRDPDRIVAGSIVNGSVSGTSLDRAGVLLTWVYGLREVQTSDIKTEKYTLPFNINALNPNQIFGTWNVRANQQTGNYNINVAVGDKMAQPAANLAVKVE